MKKIGMLIIALIVLLGGAGYLYNRLGSQNILPHPEETIQTELKDPQDQASQTEGESTTQKGSTEVNATTQEAIYLPNLTFYDLQGNEQTLDQFKGKPTIINFWASWCPPCKEEMPYFQELYDQYGDQVNFVMLNATESRPGETKEVGQSYIDEGGFTFPIYFDQDYQNQSIMGVTTLPSTLFLEADGRLIYGHRGMISRDDLDKMIQHMIE